MIEVVQRLRELSPLYEMAKEGIDISKMNWGASADRRALKRGEFKRIREKIDSSNIEGE